MPSDKQKTEEDDTKMELRKLRAAAGQCKSQFTRFETYLKEQKAKITPTSIETINQRLKNLESTLEQYANIQLNINILQDKTAEEDFLENDLEERYYKLVTEAASITSIRRSSVAVPALPTETRTSSRLPSLDIPIFTGEDITKYTSFIELFHAVIGSDQTLAKVQKLCYLRNHLRKEAEALIEGLPLCNASYDEALKLLNDRYQNKAVIITSHVNRILDFQPIQKGTALNLRELVSHVRQHTSALKNMGQNVEAWDMLLLPIILRKLDAFTARAFHMERDKGNLPKVIDLLEFIENRASSYEETQIQQCTKIVKQNKVSCNIVKSNPKADVKCLYCQKNNHKMHSCPQFKIISVDDRRKFINDKNLCIICLNSHKDKCKINI